MLLWELNSCLNKFYDDPGKQALWKSYKNFVDNHCVQDNPQRAKLPVAQLAILVL